MVPARPKPHRLAHYGASTQGGNPRLLRIGGRCPGHSLKLNGEMVRKSFFINEMYGFQSKSKISQTRTSEGIWRSHEWSSGSSADRRRSIGSMNDGIGFLAATRLSRKRCRSIQLHRSSLKFLHMSGIHYSGKQLPLAPKPYKPHPVTCPNCRTVFVKRAWNSRCPCQKQKKLLQQSGSDARPCKHQVSPRASR
jgi:hypothetical protein